MNKPNNVLLSNIFRTDSYKVTQWPQYPADMTELYSYFESRGGMFPETVFFGLNYYLQEYLSKPITMADIDYAEKRFNLHFMGTKVFNRAGFERIVAKHQGYWPVRIKAVREGTVVPNRNVLMTIESTDPELPWVVNYIETMLVKMWFPITVATLSRNIKALILSYLEKTGDPAGIDFKLHDFGYRGVSSEESAMIGGMAHLVNFKGTDTYIACEGAYIYYEEEMAGYSIPASEHSTITAWGREFEYEAYENMIKQFGAGAMFACVSDSYNIYEACDGLWGGSLKQKVMDMNGTLIVRPDSGVPHDVVRQVIEILGKRFGYTTNDKGYKVLNKVRIIQGDGIDLNEIRRILDALEIRGWSADNVAFGMGGALLQRLDRDIQKFAFKASSVTRNGTVRDIWKDPVTDNGKRSKRGKLKLIEGSDGVLETVPIHSMGYDVLRTVYENGHLFDTPTLFDIRHRAKIVTREPATV